MPVAEEFLQTDRRRFSPRRTAGTTGQEVYGTRHLNIACRILSPPVAPRAVSRPRSNPSAST